MVGRKQGIGARVMDASAMSRVVGFVGSALVGRAWGLESRAEGGITGPIAAAAASQ